MEEDEEAGSSIKVTTSSDQGSSEFSLKTSDDGLAQKSFRIDMKKTSSLKITETKSELAPKNTCQACG